MDTVLKTLMKERGICRLSGEKANQLTRECLQKALIFLMGEKSFDKISITELVKISGVSRQSFYRNYKSKEDILTDMSVSIRQSVEAFIMDSRYLQDVYQWYYDLFTFIKDNVQSIQLLFQARLHQNDGRNYIPALHEIFRAEIKENYYKLLGYEGAVNAIVTGWFEGGMKEEIADMAKLCSDTFGKIHHELLKESEKRQRMR